MLQEDLAKAIPLNIPVHILSKLILGADKCLAVCLEWMVENSWGLTLGFGTVWRLCPLISRFSRWFSCWFRAWAASHSLQRPHEAEKLSKKNSSAPPPLWKSADWNWKSETVLLLSAPLLPKPKAQLQSQFTGADDSCSGVNEGEIQGCGHLAASVGTGVLAGSRLKGRPCFVLKKEIYM